MMKKNQYIFRMLATAAVALPVSLFMFSSCSNEDNLVPTDTQGQVLFTTSVSDAPSSRADQAYQPATGNLTIYGNRWDSNVKATYGYNSNSDGWTCTSREPLYWKDITGENEYIFYAVAPQEPGTAPAVMIDQSSPANYTASDLLVARASVAAKEIEVPFVLKHVLSQLEINLSTTTGDEKLSAEELASAVVTIDGLKNAYTLTAGTTAEAPVTVVATGDPVNGMKPCQNDGKQSFRYIVVPQSVTTDPGMTLNFTVTIGGKEVEYVYNHKPTFSAGKKNVYNITISKSNLKVSVAVADWATGESQNATLTLTTSGTADELTDNSTFTGMTLWLADKVLTDFSTATSGAPLGASHTYTKDEDGAWTSETPIYLDEMTANSVIYATAINTTAADAVTGLSDYLVAGPVTVQGGAAAIQFRHGLAQMTVKLAAGTGFTADITDAAITTPAMLKNAAMVTDAEGILYFAARGDETVNYTIASGATHIVVPQTLAANSIFTVKLANGNIYEAKLTEAVTLAAGVNTTITLTLMPTKVGVSAAVTPWGEAAAAATVQLAGTNSEIGITGITEAGDLTLTYVQDDALTTTATTFSYDGNAWSNATPLYWDEIAPAAPYTFAALFTPAGDDLWKDYLVGLGTADSHGAQVALNEMKHAMAKLTVKLQAGTGVTAEELQAFTMQLTLYMSNSVAVNADGTANITLNQFASDIAFTSKTEYSLFVAPQELKDGYNDNIQLKRLNGNTYKIKLTDLTDGAETPATIFTDSKIEAGKHYQITLIVNETSVGISATIAEWTDVSGSGTVTPDFQ